MKKVFLFVSVFVGLFVVNNVMAEAITTIKAATTNTVRHSVYDITYGVPTDLVTDTSSNNYDYGYRHGTVPQTNKLSAATGNTSADVSGVTVGYLAAAATAAPSGSTGYTGNATETITANTANVAVLNRDKLVTPATGNCVSGNPCGYVSTGNDSSAPQGINTGASTNKYWMKIATCSDVPGATCN